MSNTSNYRTLDNRMKNTKSHLKTGGTFDIQALGYYDNAPTGIGSVSGISGNGMQSN